MSHLKNHSVAIAAALAAAGLIAGQVKAGTYDTISIDGSFSDWTNVPVAATDTPNPNAGIDPIQLKMANDKNNIYFELTFNGSQDPNSGSGTYLAVDSDNNASTGYSISNNTTLGIAPIGSNFGFESGYPFTESAGDFNSNGTSSNTTYTAAASSGSPTMQEISIPINASETDSTDGLTNSPLFQTPTNSFTVEFWTDYGTVLGPYTYTIAPPLVAKATYTATGSGDFNVAGNWDLGIPSGAGAEADFLGAITANHTVYSDVPITLGTIIFNNANTYVLAGAGSLTLQTTTGSGLVDAQAGTQKITLPTEIASNTVLQAESGATLIMGGPVTVDPGISLSEAGAGSVLFQSSITVDSGGSVALAAGSHAATLSLIGASTASIISETGTSKTALELDSLSLSTGSTFDLKNGDLIVQNGNLASIQQSIASGYNAHGKPWAGTGITSSVAAANTSHLTALGVIQNSVAGAALYSSFDGTPVSASDVLVKYTYYGDANLNGSVDGTDYSRIDSSFLSEKTSGKSISGWFNGDFNYDGVVDGSDYTLMDNAYNQQGTAISAQIASPTAQVTAEIAGVSSVPEPASIGILAIGSTGLLGRRRRKNC